MQTSRVGTAKRRKKFIRWGRLACALVALAALAAMLGSVVSTAQAQTYLFQIPKSTTDLYVNADGTVTVDYTYVFQNNPSADPIDAIDVGVPTTSYDLSSVSAQVNGQPVTDITESPYVKPGIALNIPSSMRIQPGDSGTVTVHIGTVRNLLFKSTQKEAEPYASFQFNPNYFGSDFVRGQTDMTVTLHLPPGLQQNEPRYFTPKNWPGSADPDKTGFDSQNRVYYTWESTSASSSAVYTFGASFPARLVPAAALVTESPFSGINLSLNSLCPWIFCLGFVGFIGLTIYGSIVGDRKRKLQYLPPKVAIEGNGIKRGLTAVEAAVLMEQPMDKILTMILFSVIKKNAATVVSKDPMKIQVATTLPEGLQPYESAFLTAMKAPGSSQRAALQNMMTDLVKTVSEKMRGFSRKETIAYYQDIMNRAWQQVEAANTPEMKMQAFDESLDWTMLDRGFNTRSRQVFGPQPVIVPMWWGRFDPTFRGASAGSLGSGGPSMSTSANLPPSGMNLPTIPGGDFAASMVGGMQTFASSVVGDVTAFTGGITNKTNPVPKPSTSGRAGGGGGGGGGCACACACAGCACACAGGGR